MADDCSYDILGLTDDHTEMLAELFRLLGDQSRLCIVLFCLNRAVSVGDIADGLGLSLSLVSHHLRLLKGAKLVRSERRGKQVFYAAADDHVRHVVADLATHIMEPGDNHDRR